MRTKMYVSKNIKVEKQERLKIFKCENMSDVMKVERKCVVGGDKQHQDM